MVCCFIVVLLPGEWIRLGVSWLTESDPSVKLRIKKQKTPSAEGVEVLPEVMIPLVGLASELARLRTLVEDTAEAVLANRAPTWTIASAP